MNGQREGAALFPPFSSSFISPHTLFFGSWRNSGACATTLFTSTRWRTELDQSADDSRKVKKEKKKTRSQGGKPRRLLRYRTDRQQQTPACLATRLRSRSSFCASTLLECRRTRRAPVAWTNNPRSSYFSHFSYSGKDCMCDQNIGGKIVAHYGNSCQSNLSVFRLCVFALHVH